MSEIFPESPLTSLPAAVAFMGALPMPVGPQSRPLSAARLAEAEERAAHLYEYGNDATADEWNRLAGDDVPVLVAEIRRQAAVIAELNESVSTAAEALRARQSCLCPPEGRPHQVGCPQAEVPVTPDSGVEFAVQYPDGETVMAETVSHDRRRAEASLRAHREVDPVMWRDCRVVQRLTPDGQWVEAASDALTQTFMPVPSLRASLEDPHDGPLAHRYLVGRDLPVPPSCGLSADELDEISRDVWSSGGAQ